jgi:hypothetical protein
MNRVAELYPQAAGSLFVAFYDSQGYGGGIRTRLHMGKFNFNIIVLLFESYFGTELQCTLAISG